MCDSINANNFIYCTQAAEWRTTKNNEEEFRESFEHTHKMKNGSIKYEIEMNEKEEEHPNNTQKLSAQRISNVKLLAASLRSQRRMEKLLLLLFNMTMVGYGVCVCVCV